MKFNAAILTELNRPLFLSEISWNGPLDAGQVLVRIFYSGVCGSQLGEIAGKKGPDKYLPHLLGHEGAAEVLEVGPGVRYVSPGDKVVMHWKKGLGIDALPAKFLWEGRTVNAGCVTTFSEYSVVSENRLTKLPEDFNLRIAPMFGCAVTTGLGVVCNNAKIRIGESVVVFGAGGVGLNIVQGARLAGAWPVIAVDLFDNRLELAARFGATHLVNADKEDAFAAIRKIADPYPDVFIDNTGNPDVISSGYAAVGPHGRVVLVGVPRQGDDIHIYSLPLHFGKSITGSFGGETLPQEDIPRYIKLYRAGILELDSLISAEYPLQEINSALEDLKSGKIAGRCLIRM